MSGKGTTHVANGIIVQKKDVGQTLGEKITVGKKNRTIAAPETNIVRYAIKERGNQSLRNESSEISLHGRRKLSASTKCGKKCGFSVPLVEKDGWWMLKWMVKVYQDGRDSIPKCIKRFEVLRLPASHRCSSYGHVNRQHTAPTQRFDLPTPSSSRSCLSFRRSNLRQSSND